MAARITISKLYLSGVPSGNQTCQIKVGKTGLGVWDYNNNAVVVFPNGNLQTTISVAGLDYDTDYDVYARNMCNADEATARISTIHTPVAPLAVPPTLLLADYAGGGDGFPRTEYWKYNGYALADVIPLGIRFNATIYGHTVFINSDGVKTLQQCIVALVGTINAVTEAQWNDMGLAPESGIPGFKPTAAFNGTYLVLTMDSLHTFAVSCEAL